VIVGRRREPRAPLQLLDLPLSAYWRFEQSPCCLNEIDVEHGKVYVRRINETRHLEEAA
jgi:probable phosphoglycerate mutase